MFDTCQDIELAVAHWFGIKTHIVLPNLSYGMFFPWESDLVILSQSNYLYEVEIKVSRADLIRDKKKRKWYNYDEYRIRKIWFAVPEKLLNSIDHIPDRAGILIIKDPGKSAVIGNIEEVRKPVVNKYARKMTDKECFTLARLGTLRMWDLKLSANIRKAQSKIS